MTDSTGKRDYAPRRSCSGRDSTATRMERLDYKPERQVLAKRVSRWLWYQKRSSYSMPELSNKHQLASDASVCAEKERLTSW
jgi:hypothetical protein